MTTTTSPSRRSGAAAAIRPARSSPAPHLGDALDREDLEAASRQHHLGRGAAASAGPRMIVGATTQRMPSASTAAARSASASSITSVRHERSVEPGDADHARPRGRARASSRSAGPFSAAPAMIGDTATTSARRAATASRTPGTASTGSIDTIGFDGAITTASASAMRLEHAGRRAGGLGAVEAHRRRRRTSCWRCTKYSWKPISPSPATVTRVCSRSSVTGSSRRPRPQAVGDLGGHLGQRRAGAQAVGAVQVGGEVAVAEVEPRARAAGSGRAPPWRATSRRPGPSPARGRWRRPACR